MMTYQVVILGSGPGGYVAALRCAQLGFKTALVEKYSTLGGTCLNVGCIPSKALLDSSEHFSNAKHHFQEHGISLDNLRADLAKMIERKQKVVQQTCQGVQYLMKKNKIEVYEGLGSFIDEKTIEIQQKTGNIQLKAEKIIIATGSKPQAFPGMEPDKKRIITSTEALNLSEIPKTLLVIGAGVIGLELGSVYARLGTQVEVVEFADRILPTMDQTISKEMQKILETQGFVFHLQHRVQKLENKGNFVQWSALNTEGKLLEKQADYVLVATGRKPYTEGLNLEKIGIKTDEKGFILVNKHLETNVKDIFAIGDVIGGWMLAHKAEEEGVYVAESLAGQKPHLNYNLIPGVVYTWPEVAAVGATENELKQKNIAYKVGNFPYKALGRARASTDLQGFVKILARQDNDEVLGVHIVGARAADMIMEAVVAMEYRASAEDIARICHPHPTYTEAIKEAALDATEKRALHI